MALIGPLLQSQPKKLRPVNVLVANDIVDVSSQGPSRGEDINTVM